MGAKGGKGLDKDLDRISLIEIAAAHVTRRLSLPGAGLMLAVFLAGALLLHAFGGGAAVLIGAAAITGFYMAVNIGANDITNNVGATVGSRALTMAQALAMGAVFEALGAVTAGDNVARTIASGIVDPAAFDSGAQFALAMMGALTAAAVWINIATWLNWPISTTHAIIGAVLGAAIAAVGLAPVNGVMLGKIVAGWVLSPFVAGALAAVTLAIVEETITYRQDKIAAAIRVVPILTAVLAASFAGFLFLEVFKTLRLVALPVALVAGGLAYAFSVPVVTRQAIGLENRNSAMKVLFRLPLVGAAAILCYAHGANDVSNAAAPVAAIIDSLSTGMRADGTVPIPLWALAVGAAGLAVGVLFFGPRLIRLVGEQITKLNATRAFCVALATALTVNAASLAGLPVSTTHIAVGAVFGIGFFREWYSGRSKKRKAYIREKGEAHGISVVEERDPNTEELSRRLLVRRSHFMTIIGAWAVTLPAAGLLSALLTAGLLLFLS